MPYKLFAALIVLMGYACYLRSQTNTAEGTNLCGSAAAQSGPDTRLFAAVYRDDPEQIRQAVAEHSGLPADSVNTALHIAALEGHQRAVDQLLKAGAPPNCRSTHGTTPLIVAAAVRGNTAVLKQLLDAGADPNAATPSGRTALSEATALGDHESVSILTAAISPIPPKRPFPPG